MPIDVSRRRVLAATLAATGLAGCGGVLGGEGEPAPALEWIPADATGEAGATKTREGASTAFPPGPIDLRAYLAVRVEPLVDADLLDGNLVSPTTVDERGRSTSLGVTAADVDWTLLDTTRVTATVWSGDVPVSAVVESLDAAGYDEVGTHREAQVFASNGEPDDAFAVADGVLAEWDAQYGEDPVTALEVLLDAGRAGKSRLTVQNRPFGRVADLLGDGDAHYVLPPIPAAEYHTSTISRAATGQVAFGRRLDLDGDVGRWRQAHVVGEEGSLDREAFDRPRDGGLDSVPGLRPGDRWRVRNRRLRFEDDAVVIDYETEPVETNENERPGTGKRTRTP